MPPNATDVHVEEDIEIPVGLKPNLERDSNGKGKEFVSMVQSGLNFLAQTLIAVIVGITTTFAFTSGIASFENKIHIFLCVVGYQFLMAHGILSLTPANSWSSQFKIVNKRRFHWVLQIVGSVLAIAGSFIRISIKTVHWDSLHGQFALVAMVFTVASLVNGLASLYAYECRKFLPMNLSKLTHICFGTVAFLSASVSLIYGFDKNGFRNWGGFEMAMAMIGLTVVLTFIIIVNPLITFASKIIFSMKK